jgi:hypothetical protein
MRSFDLCTDLGSLLPTRLRGMRSQGLLATEVSLVPCLLGSHKRIQVPFNVK